MFAVPATFIPVPVITTTFALPTALKLIFPFAAGILTLLFPFANTPTKLPALILPATVNRLVVLLNVKLALPLATPVSLNIICVSAPATGPVAPVYPIVPVAPVAPVVPICPVAPVAPVVPI